MSLPYSDDGFYASIYLNKNKTQVMKENLTNAFPIKKVIHWFLTFIFLLPSGTLQSGVRSDTNKVAIGKTKLPAGQAADEPKPASSGPEYEVPQLKPQKKADDKTGNWLLPQVVVLVYFGKKKQIKVLSASIGKMMKQAKKWFKSN